MWKANGNCYGHSRTTRTEVYIMQHVIKVKVSRVKCTQGRQNGLKSDWKVWHICSLLYWLLTPLTPLLRSVKLFRVRCWLYWLLHMLHPPARDHSCLTSISLPSIRLWWISDCLCVCLLDLRVNENKSRKVAKHPEPISISKGLSVTY